MPCYNVVQLLYHSLFKLCLSPMDKNCLPTLQRCANCGASSSRVWRAANAGLLCCNACGMYYQKHQQHRPEHLLAANRAKQAAAAAAVGALPRGPQGLTTLHSRYPAGRLCDAVLC